jgi:hypothetical protein
VKNFTQPVNLIDGVNRKGDIPSMERTESSVFDLLVFASYVAARGFDEKSSVLDHLPCRKQYERRPSFPARKRLQAPARAELRGK